MTPDGQPSLLTRPQSENALQPLEAVEVSGKRHRSECCHERGVFARIMAGLAAEHGEETTVMIDATHLKAHRRASSLCAKSGAWTSD